MCVGPKNLFWIPWNDVEKWLSRDCWGEEWKLREWREYRLSVIRSIRSVNLMYYMVTIVDNFVLYNWNLLNVEPQYSHQYKTKTKNRVWFPGRRTRSHMLKLRVCMRQLKILSAKTKTWHSQINLRKKKKKLLKKGPLGLPHKVNNRWVKAEA